MKTYLQIILLGLLNGSRAMAIPWLLSQQLATHPPARRRGLVRWAAWPPTARMFKLMAWGELVGDKLPGIPDRIEPPGLLGRGVMGALVGVILSALNGQSRAWGALLGGLAAVVGAHIGYYARSYTVDATPLPDFPVALAEDLIVIGGGKALLRLTPRGDDSQT